MKSIFKLSIIGISIYSLVSCNDDEGNPKVTESLSMGASYTNDIYYSLANGVVSTPNRTEWDIAFYTNPRTSTIIINDGNYMKAIPWKALAEWDATDTTGLCQQPVYANAYTGDNWQNGAFDQGAKGYPDYGWGVYNPNNHNVVGDSVYVLLFADGSAKKILIEIRQSTNNTFYFKYANLDGSSFYEDSVACNNYLDKNLVHYSITNHKVVEHEPAASNWDLMFTKYLQSDINYIVSGALSNNGVSAAKITGVDVESDDYSNADFSASISAIGYSWKNTNADHSYYIPENEIYFVKDQEGNVYKIVFKSFDGMSTGNFTFEKTRY
jgi:hypothetical protein